MKTYLALALLLCLAPSLPAGDLASSKEPIPAKNAEFHPKTETELGFYVPGFLPWTDATLGVRGVETNTRFGADVLLKNLDMLALAGLEGRKGKWGFILEGMYLDLGVTGETPGRLLETIDVGFEQLIAEGTVTYRIHQSERGFVELLAGARYYWLGADLGLNVSPAGVVAVSEDLGDAIVSRASTAIREELDQRLAGILAGLPTPVADLTAADFSRLEGGIRGEVDPLRFLLGNRIEWELGSGQTGIGGRFAGDGRIRELIRAYARAQLEARIEERRAAASAVVAAARQNVRQRAQQAVARAERRLAQGIAQRINSRIPQSTVSDTKGWVDPIIGLRGKYLLSDDLYVVARGDYGGFGVSSDSQFNLYGALGTQLKENVTLEIGIRHTGVDYSDGGFSYDATFTGPFSAVMIHF